MSNKPVVPRDKARDDIEEAIEYYLREAGDQAAVGFIDAVENAFQAIAAYPSAGTPDTPMNSICRGCAANT